MRRFLLVFVLIPGVAACAYAQADKYHATAAEKLACTPDALRLCMAAYPDEDRLIACMEAKRDELSAACRTVFDAGLKRRGLH